jgi:hypothetical protein
VLSPCRTRVTITRGTFALRHCPVGSVSSLPSPVQCGTPAVSSIRARALVPRHSLVSLVGLTGPTVPHCRRNRERVGWGAPSNGCNEARASAGGGGDHACAPAFSTPEERRRLPEAPRGPGAPPVILGPAESGRPCGGTAAPPCAGTRGPLVRSKRPRSDRDVSQTPLKSAGTNGPFEHRATQWVDYPWTTPWQL